MVLPASVPTVAGRQRQGVPMATLMIVKEHCQFSEHVQGDLAGGAHAC